MTKTDSGKVDKDGKPEDTESSIKTNLLYTALEHSTQTRPIIQMDYERYEKMLDKPDLTEDQKREFLQALWNIVIGFVELGWGVHPIQQVQENTCGELSDTKSDSDFSADSMVQSKDTNLTNQYKKAAG